MSLIVAAAIVDDLIRPSQILAAQRAYPPALAGQWELPGGKVEPGEDPEDGCRRELWEELSVRATLHHLYPSPTGDWPLGFADMRVWIATVDHTPQLSANHLNLAWVNAQTIMDLDWLPGDLELARSLQAFLS